MTNLYVSSLIKMSEKEMLKLRKEDIVKCLVGYKFTFESNEENVKKADKRLIEQKVNEKAAKKLLAAYTETEIPADEYAQDGIDKLDLLELVGKALLKASRY